MSGKEIEVTPQAARILMALHDTAGMDYLHEKRLARHLKISVTEVRHHMKELAKLGLVQEGG